MEPYVQRRFEVERHIAADSASVALLLAGPLAELPSGDSELPPARVTAEDSGLVVAAPRRSGVGFVADVTTTDAKDREVTGLLRIVPAADPGCDVRLIFTAADSGSVAVVKRAASRFLSTLAVRARERSFAA
jgi:hypothetical protein